MHLIEKSVLDFLRGHSLVSRGDRVVAAVSGGADSVTLLHILQNSRKELGIELHVAHLDHGLRPESAADAEYVAFLARDLGLPFTLDRRDVQSYRDKHRLTLEEAAREVRYQFLEETARRIGAASVAVAHTKNDHVETVLLHLLRGTGLPGLVGLKAASELHCRNISSLRIIRPLLCLSREQVELYCREYGLSYRTDFTNESLTPTRNRIRLELLPSIREHFNPAVDEAISRLSRLAADEVDFIEMAAANVIKSLVKMNGPVVAIDKSGLGGLHPGLRRAVLRQLLSASLGSPKDIEAVHIEDMMDIARGSAGRSVDLPGGLAFSAGYSELLLGRDLNALISLPPIEGAHPLNIPGVTDIDGWRVVASIRDAVTEKQPEVEASSYAQSLDFGTAGGELMVRARQPGDRFMPLGMGVEKKLKDFFIDAKVPQNRRSRVPIVVNPGQIVWVAGCRLDERVKVSPATARILRLEFERRSS
ncbi:tRNA lysidine(34) synthetase TilS [Dehalogenimonas sp. 4OHTPN]|uniref:tRNA(Ile)-lysidine synthase n=1 Tax=Dehalogenimonas sp. 4OHTPN TaxID=3166643 RepID=A0AAU8GCS1_9CHLR